MQDIILRALVVVAGLIMYQREDLSVQDQDDDITMGMQEQDSLLLKEREWLAQEITPANQELPKEDQDDLKQVNPHQPQVDQRMAQIDGESSQEGLEETEVKQTHLEEDKAEKDVEMTHARPDHDSDQIFTPQPQGEPDTDYNPPVIEPEETRDQVQPNMDADVSPKQVNLHQPQADQRMAQTDHESSQEGLEESQVKQTHLEDKGEKDIEMTHVRPGDDSDQTFTPEHQGEPDIDYKPSVVESGETQDQVHPNVDADVSPIDEKQHLLEEEVPLVDQRLSQDVQEGGSLTDHQIRPESAEEVALDQKEPQEDHEVHLPITEPPLEEVVETYQEVPHKDKKAPPPQVFPESSEEEQGGQEPVTDTEDNFMWYIWNTYSVISMIHFSIKYFRKKSQNHQMKDLPGGEMDILMESKLAAEILLPDSDTLNRFYDKCVKVSPNESWKVSEFVEDFAKDLLGAMRAMSDRAVGMVMEDFEVVEGVINSSVFDVIVPLTPSDQYRFQYQLWCNQAGDIPGGCGRIKMEEGVQKQNGCPCGNSDMDNIICLLHSENEKLVNKVSDSPLWSKTSPYLSKAQVTKWFQSEIRQVWSQISHKYEFELTFRNMDTPGALSVRFRSGKVITFNIKPVVKFKETDVYFTISPSTTNKDKTSDNFWGLSLTMYEDRFLKHLAKSLPENTCHLKCMETAAFLSRMQTRLTGRSGLTDYHFKTALLHLLLVVEHSEWHPRHFTNRLRDLLSFLEESLQHRKLHHTFIGNPLLPTDISLSGELGEAKPVNLFRPLVVQNGLYAKTVKHFQEMLKNSSVLIQEYAPK